MRAGDSTLHQDWQPGRQTLSQNTAAMHSTVNQLDMMDTQGTFHLTVAGHTFFSRSHAAQAMGDNILSYKIYLNNSNRKIIQSILSKSYLSEFKLNACPIFLSLSISLTMLIESTSHDEIENTYMMKTSVRKQKPVACRLNRHIRIFCYFCLNVCVENRFYRLVIRTQKCIYVAVYKTLIQKSTVTL